MRVAKAYQLAFLLTIFVAAKAVAIVGGQVVHADDPVHGVTVLAYPRQHPDDFCSGTKLGPKTVLVAGHCHPTIVQTTNGLKSKVIGSVSLYHPHKPDSFDVSVLRLSRPLPGPYAILANRSLAPRTGQWVWIAGFGDYEPKVEADRRLRKLAVRVGNPDYTFSETKIDEHGRGACYGDSGGPEYTLINGKVAVWGVDSGDLHDWLKPCVSGEVYTRVAPIRSWIAKFIRNPHLIEEHHRFRNASIENTDYSTADASPTAIR